LGLPNKDREKQGFVVFKYVEADAEGGGGGVGL